MGVTYSCNRCEKVFDSDKLRQATLTVSTYPISAHKSLSEPGLVKFDEKFSGELCDSCIKSMSEELIGTR